MAFDPSWKRGELSGLTDSLVRPGLRAHCPLRAAGDLG